MRIIILPLAEADLDEIYTFYAEKSDAVALKVYHAILDEMEILTKFPYIAPVESILEKQQVKVFRSLLAVKGKFRITYFVETDTVFITHIWSCRQNPKRLTNRLKK